MRRCERPRSTSNYFPSRPTNFGSCSDCRKHPAEVEQVTRLDVLYMSAKRSGRGRQLNAEFLQPVLCAFRL